MSEERSFSETVLEISSNEEFVAKCQRVVTEIGGVKPETVICTMGVMVTTEGVKLYTLGTDNQLAKMLLTLADTVRTGMQQANNPPTPTDEAKH